MTERMADLMPSRVLLPWEYDDGGRHAAGFRGHTGDCVVRAIAIATGRPYREVYDAMHAGARAHRDPRINGTRSPRRGVYRQVYEPYLFDLGWVWTPTMSIGSGTRVHLRRDELPEGGRLIVRLSRHVCAVVDGVVRDTADPTRSGVRCVYGYYEQVVT